MEKSTEEGEMRNTVLDVDLSLRFPYCLFICKRIFHSIQKMRLAWWWWRVKEKLKDLALSTNMEWD